MERIEDTWIAFRDPREIWKDNPSQVIIEFAGFICAFLTFIHACRVGGRQVYLWLAIILHGLVVEFVSYMLPEINSFWHAQCSVMLRGGRLPLYITVVYDVFIYTAATLVSRMKLKLWAESIAVGLATVLIDVPYDITGIKYMAWTWHDTDPNIYDRAYWVPITSYYFHCAFASSLWFLFNGTHNLLSRKTRFEYDGFFKEVFCMLITGCLAMPIGSFHFIPIYHLLHDNFAIHTGLCTFLYLGLFLTLAWSADRTVDSAKRVPARSLFDELTLVVWIWFPTFIYINLVGEPEKARSYGLHEPIGNCKDTIDMHTIVGQVLKKRKYLCLSDYDEGYYDFHCLPKPPSSGNVYTICGTPYENRVEMLCVITSVCLLGLFIFTTFMMRYTAPQSKKSASSTKKKQ